jgi:hypothetical protein
MASDHLVRSTGWNGLLAGDPVVVSGVKARGQQWEFRAHVLNTNNGVETIEVVGGRNGDRTVRSFAPDRIFAVTAKTRGRTIVDEKRIAQASLAEAPQLPFG